MTLPKRNKVRLLGTFGSTVGRAKELNVSGWVIVAGGEGQRVLWRSIFYLGDGRWEEHQSCFRRRRGDRACGCANCDSEGLA